MSRMQELQGKKSVSRVEELEQSVLYHSTRYYNNDEPEISDAAFDALTDELRRLSPRSRVLARVGATPTTQVWPEVKHVRHMGSQHKKNSAEECREWMKSTGAEFFCWSWKLDGNSLANKHAAGALVHGWSRGDGETGSDITPNTLRMGGIPMLRDVLLNFWARSEIIMPLATFDSRYKGRTNPETGKPYKNPRNTAGGIARRQSGVGCEDLVVVAYDVDIEVETQYEKFLWLQEQGFLTPQFGRITADEVGELYERFLKTDRAACPYEIDGLIIAVDNLALQRKLGMTDNRPKGQVALKFPAEEKETTILSVTWQTGRTGRVTPVAEVEPTDIGGVTISRVTLNNYGLLKERGYGIGARVMLRRANDVIPELDVVIAPGTPIPPPAACPSCSGPVVETTKVLIECKNKSCPAQTTAHLLNFLRVINVKGFGLSTIEALVESGRLTSVADFYQLQAADFDSEKTGAKLVAEFAAKSKELPLPVFVDALGIPGVGQHLTELAMGEFPTLAALRGATVDELVAIPGIGAELAGSLVEGLVERSGVIDALLKYVTIVAAPTTLVLGDKFKGMTFCFTGFRDGGLEVFIRREGGEVASSMNKSVTHLVAKDVAGGSTKLDKARAKGLTVWSRDQLEAMQ